MIFDRADISVQEFERATGWEIKAEGACKGDVCVPLPTGEFDVATTAERLGMAIAGDRASGVWALGPEAVSGRALSSADASDFTLPDLDGNPFHIGSLQGQKVLVVSWAPY